MTASKLVSLVDWSVGCSGVVGLLLALFRGSDRGIASTGFASYIDLVVTLSVNMEH